MPTLAQRAFGEALGTAFLLAAVVGSGIMAQRTFAGIAPASVFAFIVAQMLGALGAVAVSRWLWGKRETGK